MTEYSRRQFLHDSLLAAAAAATAGPIGNVLAAEITATVPAKGPNEKLSFAIIGVNGQGNSHIGNLVKKQGEVDIAIICDVDETIGNKCCDEIAKQQDGRRPKYVRDSAPSVRRQVDRLRFRRRAQSLARAGRDLGHAGRQRRVRRKAGQPQRERRPARWSKPLASTTACARPARSAARCGGMSEAIEVRARRQDRRSERWPAACATSARGRSDQRASTMSRRTSTTTCGAARRRWPSRPTTVRRIGTGPLRLALGVALPATAIWATRASTRWISPAGAWASIR